MRGRAVFLLPFLCLFLSGCSNQTTAPELDIAASFGKGGKPGKPPPDGDPPVSADPAIAYERGGPGGRALWVMDEDGSNQTEIFEPGKFFVPSWSSLGDGTDPPFQILITGTSSNLLPVMKVEVILDADGVPTVGMVDTLTTNASYVQGRVSPDGLRFVTVFVGTPPEFDNGGLVVSGMNAFSPDMVIQISGHQLYWPVWYSDTEIAFFDRDNGTEATTVQILELGSGPPTELVQVPAELGTPRRLSWSPSGAEFLFDAGGEFFRVTLGGAEPVLEGLGSGIGPSWSPNGSQIVYSNRDRLYLKTIGGRGKDGRLTNGRMPDWRR